MAGSCQHSANAASYVSGELSQRDVVRFESHLETCELCRAEVRSTRALIFRLQSPPKFRVTRDLASGILARAREEERKPEPVGRRFAWADLAAAAALAAFFAGGAWFKHRHDADAMQPQPIAMAVEPVENAVTASAGRALDWFCQTQESDGSWDAVKWGGNRRFEIALTALPLLALMDGESTPQRSKAIALAAAYVERQQNADGTFGQPFREAPYIQSVSTLALLRVYERTQDATLRPALHAALRVVFATQSPDGGWGYGAGSAASEAITLWHRDVVALAARLGWEQAGYSLELAEGWLRSRSGSDPISRAALAGTDFHRAYFAVEALRREGTGDAERKLADIRSRLIASQADGGATSGTWTPVDQWGRVGGRIYSTALASLALR